MQEEDLYDGETEARCQGVKNGDVEEVETRGENSVKKFGCEGKEK